MMSPGHFNTAPVLQDLSTGARLLIGMAIGDAFGAGFENRSRYEIRLPDEIFIYKGSSRYTDDTQMAIGVADLLVSAEPFTEEKLAESLLLAYKRDPRPGYSPVTTRMLQDSKTGSEFLLSLTREEIRERKSDGAAMRALPIGLIPDREEVIRCAMLSSRITHGHPDAIAATVGIALICHERYYSGKSFLEILKDLPDQISALTPEGEEYLRRVIGSGWSPETILREHASYGVPYTESLILLGAVVAILARYGEEPCQVLRESVLLGGDTDTTAAIALGAALISFTPGSRGEDLPAELITGLENGMYGRDYLIELGNLLSRRFPVRAP
ncbi:ADP-ribosylglycohydrolase family protein [uncultured Methanospirillum sp.]|uniref:ADP-ribosylglycohydrolase family protein n=1 Tax=uncultured Methanospirillum sp. TaxID=262503 RepID=UPI0029C82EBD|nr:ADP-ribosylglycohydrolase family protein [uncultured Methanospirillum sp.]